MMPFTPVSLPPVALLVDGENMSKDFAEALLREAETFGIPTVRRVYGKSEHIMGWEDFGFRLVPTRPGKNAADMLLCVEAMSLALKQQFQTLLIASSDRDFSYVAEHLRELGHHVVGMGEKKAPQAFRKSCTGFVEMPTSSPIHEIPVEAKKAPSAVNKSKAWIVKKIKAVIKESSDIEGWATIQSMGQLLSSKHGIDLKDTGKDRWRPFLECYAADFECGPKGPNARVRLKP